MTKIAILPVPGANGTQSYWALAGEKRSEGATPGAALDALTAQLPPSETDSLVIVQSRRPDRFFAAEQQARLANLMARWRAARHQGQALPDEEQAELEALVDAEVRASGARAAALADELGR